LKIKGAPSENWREVIELWQCHNESFDNYVNADTREIQVPSNLTLAYFNTLILAKDATLANITIQGSILRCDKCKNILGFIQNQQRSVFLSTIKETQGILELE
jgi:HECT-like Ubiquitin-conjugating enzyme (E2)-binding